MPPRHAFQAELHEVADQPQVRSGREDPFLLRDVLLQDVGLQRPVQALPRNALALGGGQEVSEHDHGRPADRHRGRDVAERDLVEQLVEVLERISRDPAAPDLALGERVVRVATHQRGHVEGDREAASAAREQVLVPGVGLGGSAVPGELPHRP
jgi:hypothetical protein